MKVYNEYFFTDLSRYAMQWEVTCNGESVLSGTLAPLDVAPQTTATLRPGYTREELAAACPGSVARGGADGVRLTDWTAAQFAQNDALIFVGAAGIAVRAIAPHCRSKAADPAVVVLDEGGRFAIPLLSGHLGGANELAQRLAAVCHAVPVITTATDGRGVFAVDEWAKRQNCAVAEPERIRYVSGALLAGQSVCYAADWVVSGTPPGGCGACRRR